MTKRLTPWLKYIDWQVILRAAGVASGDVPPSLTSRCPRCQCKTLPVFNDQLLRAPWFSCSPWCFAGGPIEFCCWALKTHSKLAARCAIERAAFYFGEELPPGVIDAYLAQAE